MSQLCLYMEFYISQFMGLANVGIGRGRSVLTVLTALGKKLFRILLVLALILLYLFPEGRRANRP